MESTKSAWKSGKKLFEKHNPALQVEVNKNEPKQPESFVENIGKASSDSSFGDENSVNSGNTLKIVNKEDSNAQNYKRNVKINDKFVDMRPNKKNFPNHRNDHRKEKRRSPNPYFVRLTKNDHDCARRYHQDFCRLMQGKAIDPELQMYIHQAMLINDQILHNHAVQVQQFIQAIRK